MSTQLHFIRPSDLSVWQWNGSFWAAISGSEEEANADDATLFSFRGRLWSRILKGTSVTLREVSFSQEDVAELLPALGEAIVLPGAATLSAPIVYRSAIYWLAWSGTGSPWVFHFDGTSLSHYKGAGPSTWADIGAEGDAGYLIPHLDRLAWCPSVAAKDRLIRLDMRPASSSLNSIGATTAEGIEAGTEAPIAALSHKGSLVILTASGLLKRVDGFLHSTELIYDLQRVAHNKAGSSLSVAAPHTAGCAFRTAGLLNPLGSLEHQQYTRLEVLAGAHAGKVWTVLEGENTASGYEWKVVDLEGKPVTNLLQDSDVIQAYFPLNTPGFPCRAHLFEHSEKLCGVIIPGSAHAAPMQAFRLDGPRSVTRVRKGTEAASLAVHEDPTRDHLCLVWSNPSRGCTQSVEITLGNMAIGNPNDLIEGAGTERYQSLLLPFRKNEPALTIGEPGIRFRPNSKTVEIPLVVETTETSISIVIEFDAGAGWKRATAKASDPAHSLGESVGSGSYIFVHDTVVDQVGPSSVQYRFTVVA